jgi:hypothetical protein
MSSLKQIEANRRNALKSTGPTTLEGKARSRCNAVRHGLTAETVIDMLEDAEDYQAFEAAVIADYDAETAVERELVLRLASVLWRLRRATGIETALFESVTTEPSKDECNHSRLNLVGELTCRSTINYSWKKDGNPKLQQQMSTFSLQEKIPGTASCAWQHSRLFLWIVLAATNTCCAGNLSRLCLRSTHSDAVSDSPSAQLSHFHSAAAIQTNSSECKRVSCRHHP